MNMRFVAPIFGALLLPGAAPAQTPPTTVLRVTPVTDLATLDPTGAAGTQTYVHGTMVYDTLFAMDASLRPQPQMVGAESVSADGLTYRLTLRDPARRRTLMEHLSARLWEVMPAVVLGQRAQVYAWRNEVTGFIRTPPLNTNHWNIETSARTPR